MNYLTVTVCSLKQHDISKFTNNKTEQVFFDILDFPEFKFLESKWKIIRDEIPIFDVNKINPEYKRNKGKWNSKENIGLFTKIFKKPGWVKGWNTGWYHYPIVYTGKYMNSIDSIMPETYKILKKYPNIYVAGISVLIPHAILQWHRDETGRKNNSLALNLGLISDNAILSVKDSNNKQLDKFQETGKSVIFDANYYHSVNNHSDTIRFILYIDFKTNNVYGTRIKGNGSATKLDYPTVNLILNKNIECGFYNCKSLWGECILIVNKTKRFGECHFKEFDKEIDSKNTFYLSDLNKLNKTSGVVGMYNKACEC